MIMSFIVHMIRALNQPRMPDPNLQNSLEKHAFSFFVVAAGRHEQLDAHNSAILKKWSITPIADQAIRNGTGYRHTLRIRAPGRPLSLNLCIALISLG